MDGTEVDELVEAVSRIPDVVGRPGTVLADNGYANGNEVAKLERMGVEALVATGAEGGLADSDEKEDGELGGPVEIPFAQADGGAGVRNHQERFEIHEIFVAGVGKSPRRMGAGGALV